MVEIGEGIIPDTIAFYVTGSEKVANILKVQLSVNDSSRSNISQNMLLDVSNVLCQGSLNRYLPDEIRSAILNGKPHTEIYGNKKVSLEKEIWPGHVFGGYNVDFIVSSI